MRLPEIARTLQRVISGRINKIFRCGIRRKTMTLANLIKKYLLIFSGSVALVLGIVGVFVPVLPTTPFFAVIRLLLCPQFKSFIPLADKS